MRVARLLPASWAERLVEAASIDDEFERRKAIEEVIRRLRFEHPELFRSEREPYRTANEILKPMNRKSDK